MHEEHLRFIFAHFKLGLPREIPQKINGSRGGSFLWKVLTDQKSYAIKQLAPTLDLCNENLISRYELTETIAERFVQKGILAVPAINVAGKHLVIVDDVGYLLYPWIDGYTLERNTVSETHAIKIAEVVSKLHAINMNVPEIKEPRIDIHKNDNIINDIDKAASFYRPLAKKLKKNQPMILSMNNQYISIIPALLEDIVVTHGDLDQLNVIWNTIDNPFLIDWESVKKMNRTRDIVRTSLNWSGIGSEDFSIQTYAHMLHVYKKSGGALNGGHIEASLYSLVGNMIHWMIYNIESVCINNTPTVKDAAIAEINWVLNSMMRFKDTFNELLQVTVEQSDSAY